eukprot:jgi/Chlat1/3936/Chrsp26S04032
MAPAGAARSRAGGEGRRGEASSPSSPASSSNSNSSTPRLSLFVLKVETTGVDPEEDRVLKISLRRAGKPGEGDQRHWFVGGQPEDQPQNVEFHGITADMLRGQPAFDKVWEQVVAWVQARVEAGSTPLIVAHTAHTFHVPILRRMIERCGAKSPPDSWRFACSRNLSYKVWPGNGDFKLSALCVQLSLPLGELGVADVNSVNALLAKAVEKVGFNEFKALLRQDMLPMYPVDPDADTGLGNDSPSSSGSISTGSYVKDAQSSKRMYFSESISLASSATGVLNPSQAEQLAIFAFDTETTGRSKFDRVVEFGICKLSLPAASTADITDSTSWLIDPGKAIRNWKVHGITDEMVQAQPDFNQVWLSVQRWVAERVEPGTTPLLVAHNLRFDLGMLRNELIACNLAAKPMALPTDWLFVDSCPVARKAWPDAESYRLGALCALLNISMPTAHRAEADAVALGRLLHAAASQLGSTALVQLLRSLMVPFDQSGFQTALQVANSQVYYASTGDCYHTNYGCVGLRSAFQIQSSTQVPLGRRRCRTCPTPRSQASTPPLHGSVNEPPFP